MNYTKRHEQALKGIARYLTGFDVQSLIRQYNAGKALIKTDKGHSLTPSDVRFICSYLKMGSVLQ